MTKMWRYSFAKLGPTWLVGRPGQNPPDDAEKILYSLFLLLDSAAEKVYQGLYARFPEYAPADALGALGRDRQIKRGFAESATDYAARLIRYLDDWRTAGNPFALMRQLRGYLGVAVRIRTVDRRGNWFTLHPDGTTEYTLATGNWNWDGVAASPRWARFWVIIYPLATGVFEEGETWGDPELWGNGTWGNPGYTWGSTATSGQVKSLREIVRDWKPAGTRCEYLIIAFDENSFDPTAPEPDGTWGLNGDGAGNRTRLDTARYIRGPR